MTTTAAELSFVRRLVRVFNVDVNRAGILLIFVFGERGFPKDHAQALRSYTLPPHQREVELSVEAPRDGDFAIKVLHDEDMDGRVTKNWTGIVPKEGLGFSAGATILCGTPPFCRARIESRGADAIEIVMRYPGRFGI